MEVQGILQCDREDSPLVSHLSQRGTPAIQATIRYTQVSRSHVREKLWLLERRLVLHTACIELPW